MEIHELPSGTLANEDVLAVDNGANTRKLNFKNIVNSLITEADLTDNPVAFTSGDAASPTAWSSVSVITSGSTLATLFNRISTMVKNVRWLYSKLGTTDISSIGNGTVTGAISALNGKIGNVKPTYITGNVTLPAGTKSSPAVVDINLSSYVSGSILGIEVFLGVYRLPYVLPDGSSAVGTWVYSAEGRSVRLANSASAWNNYPYYIVIWTAQ